MPYVVVMVGRKPMVMNLMNDIDIMHYHTY